MRPFATPFLSLACLDACAITLASKAAGVALGMIQPLSATWNGLLRMRNFKHLKRAYPLRTYRKVQDRNLNPILKPRVFHNQKSKIKNQKLQILVPSHTASPRRESLW